MPLKPGARGYDLRKCRFDLVPAHFGAGRSMDSPTQGMGHDLGPKTDPKDRDSGLMGRLNQSRFGRDFTRDVVPIDAPF